MYIEHLVTVLNILLHLIITNHKFWIYCGSGFF